MPWKPTDAPQHTAKANTPSRQKLWAKVANRTRKIASDGGDPDPDATAIRTANATIDCAQKHAGR